MRVTPAMGLSFFRTAAHMAQALRGMAWIAHGVAMLGFDLVLAERDPSSGIDVLDRLARENPVLKGLYTKIRPSLDFDARFAASLKDRPVVLGYYFNNEERAVRVNALPEPVLPRGAFQGKNVRFDKWRGYTGALPIYVRNAAAVGHINPLADFDGVSRRVPLILEYDEAYYESLSLAMVRTYLRISTGQPPAVAAGPRSRRTPPAPGPPSAPRPADGRSGSRRRRIRARG